MSSTATTARSVTCVSRITEAPIRRKLWRRKPSDTAGRVRARDLQKRLPDALYLVETREQCFGFSPETQKSIWRMQEQFRNFVALCARKEQECGIPCMIVASS